MVGTQDMKSTEQTSQAAINNADLAQAATLQKYGCAPARRRRASVIFTRRSVNNEDSNVKSERYSSNAKSSSISRSSDSDNGHNAIPIYSSRCSSRQALFSNGKASETTAPHLPQRGLSANVAAAATIQQHKQRRYFDSADWMLSLQGLAPAIQRCSDTSRHFDLPTCYEVREVPVKSIQTQKEKKPGTQPARKLRKNLFPRDPEQYTPPSRTYFDSADYETSGHRFRTYHSYKGGFTSEPTAAQVLAFRHTEPHGRKFFDSADWSVPQPQCGRSAQTQAALEASRPHVSFAHIQQKHQEYAENSDPAKRSSPPEKKPTPFRRPSSEKLSYHQR